MQAQQTNQHESIEIIAPHLTRQFDLIPMTVMNTPITIIGAGAIGGWTTLSLAKMGFCNIRVIDFDKVDIVNMNSQFYRFKDIERQKVDALKVLVEEFTRIKIDTSNQKYENGAFSGIVISAVDSMQVRKLIFDQNKDNPFCKLIIDPRMGAESAMLFAMRPTNKDDIENYEKSLYTDENAVQERCTAKSTIYTANLLSGMVVKTVKDYLVNKEYPHSVIWDIAKDHFMAWRTKL